MNIGQTKRPLRGLPKVELHRHLDCSMRFSTLMELAPHVDIDVPSDLQQAKEHFLVLEPMRDLGSVLRKFLTSQKVLQSSEILERLIYECIEDAYEDGIRILELRWAPGFILENQSQIKATDILQSFAKGQERALKKFPMAIGHIGIIQRIKEKSEAHQWMDFFIDHKDFFVAADLADDENHAPAQHFQDVFSKAQKSGLDITIHAGEAPSEKAVQNVKDSIELLGATRIGHGLQIHKDEKACQWLAQKNILLELCPWSNVLTQAVHSIEQHPIKNLIERGIKVSINTDDPGIFHIDLTHEYELLEKYHAFTEKQFNQINDWAATASFIPLKTKQKYWPRAIS